MMPAEDPNKADELLKRYAKKRREQGGDFSLHPATRRLLQGEVARHFGPSSRSEGKFRLLTWLALFRRRALLGGTACALVALVAWGLWNSSHEEPTRQLARLEDNVNRDSKLNSQPRDLLGEFEERAPIEKTPAPAELADAAGEKQLGLQNEALASAPAGQGRPPVAPFFGAGYAIRGATSSVGWFDSSLAWTAPSAMISYSFNTSTMAFGTTASTNVGLLTSVVTNGAMLAGSYAKAEIRDEVGEAGDALNAAGKRLDEVARLKLRSEAKEQASGLQTVPTAAAAVVSAPASPSALNVPMPSGSVASRSVGTAGGLAGAKPDIAPTQKTTPAAGASSRTAELAAVFYRESDASVLAPVGQAMRRLETIEKKMEGQATVLNQFTLEQRGNKVRLTEPDGSVYEGALDAAGIAARTGAEAGEERESLDRFARDKVGRQNQSNQRQYLFQAVGSNVTLHQNVVVNALITAEDGPAETLSAQSAFGGGAGPAGRSERPASRAAAPRARDSRAFGQNASVLARNTNQISAIEGTVRIGLTNEQRFKAVPALR